MSITTKSLLFAGYVTLPGLAVFLLGYGGLERAVSAFFQIFVFSLVVLVVYDVFLLCRCLNAAIHKATSPSLVRFLVITGTLLSLAILPPTLSKTLRRAGAVVRLKASGGDKFCKQLLSDASRLTATNAGQLEFIPADQLPESFRRIDGESARVQGGGQAQVNIRTSGRPYATGWILIPEGSSEVAGPDAIKITGRIFRY